MDTSAINYRVADFLKQHPPFQAVDDADLLALAARGRVRFHEANEYILWQGEPHKSHVFVLQQGTVSLWDESNGEAILKDVRGAGDMLGVERFAGAPFCIYSARSASDVVIYSFPASDFADLILRHPYARQFVDTYDTVAAAYEWARNARDPQHTRLHEIVGQTPPATCSEQATIRDAAHALLLAGSDALAVIGADRRIRGVVTTDAVLACVAAGQDTAQLVGTLLPERPASVAADASVADAVLALAEAGTEALVVTAGDAAHGDLHAVVTSSDIGMVFGDRPLSILRDIRLARTLAHLRGCNHRARALALRFLTSADSVGWLVRFISMVDAAIVTRILTLTGMESTSACWCVCGVSGRHESLTRHAPDLVLIGDDASAAQDVENQHTRMREALADCDYLPREDSPFDQAFHAARRDEWLARYESWLQDPVRAEMYRARPFFDLRPVYGQTSLWQEVEATIAARLDRDFLFVLSNDCLASLPPLTFFQDAVVEESGEQSTTFRLEQSALRPLVDVGRVFGMAARRVLGTSTRERFDHARRLLPEHARIFREASDTLDILLWQQARIGISQGTAGSELPPTLLSRQDRHVLKSGFRSILELVQLTGDSSWLESV